MSIREIETTADPIEAILVTGGTSELVLVAAAVVIAVAVVAIAVVIIIRGRKK